MDRYTSLVQVPLSISEENEDQRDAQQSYSLSVEALRLFPVLFPGISYVCVVRSILMTVAFHPGNWKWPRSLSYSDHAFLSSIETVDRT